MALGNLMWNRRRLVIGGGQKRATREGWGGLGDWSTHSFMGTEESEKRCMKIVHPLLKLSDLNKSSAGDT